MRGMGDVGTRLFCSCQPLPHVSKLPAIVLQETASGKGANREGTPLPPRFEPALWSLYYLVEIKSCCRQSIKLRKG